MQGLVGYRTGEESPWIEGGGEGRTGVRREAREPWVRGERHPAWVGLEEKAMRGGLKSGESPRRRREEDALMRSRERERALGGLGWPGWESHEEMR